MLRLITDFDGPIMDVSERYYYVYLYCLDRVALPQQFCTVLKKEEFWHMKRAQVSEVEIGRRSGLEPAQCQYFAHLRFQTVHTLPYLVHDRLHKDAVATLDYIQSLGMELVVMTMRRVCELEDALDRHHLSRYFPGDRRYCLSNDYIKTGDTNDKPLLMKRALEELPPADSTWMVGDTEADLIAAQTYNIPVIAVLSGIRNQEQLQLHNPLAIVANLREAVDYIEKQSLENPGSTR